MEVSKMTFQISLEIQRKLAAFFILVRSYFEKSVRNLLILDHFTLVFLILICAGILLTIHCQFPIDSDIFGFS